MKLLHGFSSHQAHTPPCATAPRGPAYLPSFQISAAVPIKAYDETIKVLKSAVQKAKLGREEELGALRRLDEQARSLERHAGGPSAEEARDSDQEQYPVLPMVSRPV
jgi:hypothetical protein